MADLPDSPRSSPSRSKGDSVVAAGGIMMGALLLSRILGLLRETVVADRFGLRLDADSWSLATQIPDMIFMLIAGGGLSSAFIPVFSEFIYTDREKDAWKVFSVVVTLCSIVATVLIAIAWVCAPEIAAFFCAGKTITLPNGHIQSVAAQEAVQVTYLGRILLPAQFAFLVGSVLLGTLYARKRFLGPGLAPNVYNLGIIVGALLGSATGMGLPGLAWGALIGAIIGNLILPVTFMIGRGGWLKPSLDFRAPGVKKFFVLLIPVILGFSLPSVCSMITQKFASEYSEGTNIVMRNANNLMMAPLGIFGHSLALAAFPALSQFFAQDRMDLYRQQISKTLRTTIYLGMPSSALMFALAPQIVDLILGYGKASHDPHALAEVAAAVRVFSFAIWAWCMQPVLMRGFFSVHQTARPVIIGTVMTALFIVLCATTLHTSIGFLALPAATNVAAILLVVGLYFGLEKQVGALDGRGVMVTLGKSLVGSVVMGGLAYGIYKVLPAHPGKLLAFLLFGVVCCVIGWVYYFVTRALGMPETEYLSRAMNRLSRRRSAPRSG